VTWVAWFIPALGLAAGWLLWTRLPPGVDDRDDPLETVFATLLAGTLLTGCAALLLAELGLLRPPVLAAALGAIVMALRFARRRSPPRERAGRADILAFAAVAAMAVVTLAPASEEVLGGRDEGVYTNIAAWVARHGTLRIHSGALASLAPEARPVFHASVLVPGFYIGDAAEGEIHPQFFHLHPVLMALGFWLGGVTAGLMVPPLYGLISYLGTFLLARRLMGAWTGLTATLLLALVMPQMWVLRGPFSEGAAQFTATAMVWCLARASATGGLRWGVLGGLAAAAGFLVRVDAVLILLPLLPALAVLHASSPHSPRWALLAFLPLAFGGAGWSMLHAWEFTPRYIEFMYRYLGALWTLVAVMLALYGGSLIARRHARALVERAYRKGVWWWALAALLVVAAFVFGMWVRPHFNPWTYQGRRVFIEATMSRVAWYCSTLGMVTACAGIVMLLWRWLVGRRAEVVPFVAVFLALSLAYFWNPRVSIDHPWGMRRFVPVILPGLAIGVAAALWWLWSARGRWRLAARVAAILVLAVVLVEELRMTRPYWSFREKAGAIDQLASVARHIPAGALLLQTAGAEVWIATPLAFVWGYDMLPVRQRPGLIPGEGDPREIFEAQVRRWLQDGRSVYYLTRDEGHWLYPSYRLRWEPVTRFDFEVHRAGLYRTGPPKGPDVRVDSYHLVRITAGPDQPPSCAGLSLNAADPVYGRTQGFHAVERDQAGPFRWTYPNSRVVFPVCDRRGSGFPAVLRVRARCSRASAERPCRVEVQVNGEPAGLLSLTRSWEDHGLAIPAGAIADPQGAVDARFDGPSFRAGRGRGRDRRVLSFQVQQVALESAASASAAAAHARPEE